MNLPAHTKTSKLKANPQDFLIFGQHLDCPYLCLRWVYQLTQSRESLTSVPSDLSQGILDLAKLTVLTITIMGTSPGISQILDYTTTATATVKSQAQIVGY